MRTRYYGRYKVVKRTHKVGGVEYEVYKASASLNSEFEYCSGGLVGTFYRLRDAKALCCKLDSAN
ncbi:hypothetical protein N9219_01740 [bacterium]|nr:hypothetical protein [bacterium]